MDKACRRLTGKRLRVRCSVLSTATFITPPTQYRARTRISTGEAIARADNSMVSHKS